MTATNFKSNNNIDANISMQLNQSNASGLIYEGNPQQFSKKQDAKIKKVYSNTGLSNKGGNSVRNQQVRNELIQETNRQQMIMGMTQNNRLSSEKKASGNSSSKLRIGANISQTRASKN